MKKIRTMAIRHFFSAILSLLVLDPTCHSFQTPPADHRFSLRVAANSSADIESLRAEPQVVALFVRGGYAPRSSSLRVFLADQDITERVTYTERIDYTWQDRHDRQRLMEQARVYEVDLAAVPLLDGDEIRYVYDVSYCDPGGNHWTLEAFGTTLVTDGPGDLTACISACVCRFVSSLGATKQNGKVRFSPPPTPQDLANAEQALRECLAECNPPQMSLSHKVLSCNGLSVKIDMRGDNGFSSLNSSVTGSYDLVIAIAGNACSTSTMDGGNATSTNTQAGGASLAIGGNGGNHDAGTPPGQPGNGGTSRASSTNGGGDAFALGGNGGDGPGAGGVGGEASSTTSGSGSTAYAQGGEGGDPFDPDPVNPPDWNGVEGGAGGNAVGNRAGVEQQAAGAGQSGGEPLEPGTHGGNNVGGFNGAYVQNGLVRVVIYVGRAVQNR